MRPTPLLLLLATAACAPAATPSLSVVEGTPRTDARYVLEPGPVTRFGPDDTLVSGQFTLQRAEAAQGAPAQKTGGACLVYQPTMPAHCNTGDETQCPAVANTYPYCIPEDGDPQRTCWYKPIRGEEDVACNKQPVIDLVADVRHQTPLVAGFPVRPVRWRVVTCQNVVPGGCASGKAGEQVVRYGPVARFD